MDKIKAYVANHIVSWVIEIVAISIVGMITVSEIRKTNEQTREMLTSISAFAADRQEAVGGAIDSIANEAQNVEIGGKIDINTLGEKAKNMWLESHKDSDEDSE